MVLTLVSAVFKTRRVKDAKPSNVCKTYGDRKKPDARDNVSIKDDSNKDNVLSIPPPTTNGSYSPLNKRVVVFGPDAVASPHPRLRYSTKSELSSRALLDLKRVTTSNIFKKGNAIGSIEYSVCFLPVSEILKVSISRINFVEGYTPDRDIVYVTTTTTTNKGKYLPITSKERQITDDSKHVEIAKDMLFSDVDVCGVFEGAITFTVFSFKKYISRSHICLAETTINVRDSLASRTMTAKLIRP